MSADRARSASSTAEATPEPGSPRAGRIGLRIVLGILCAYHLGVGVLSWASPEHAARFGRSFYASQLALDPQASYMLRALGMYALFTGALAAAAFAAPDRRRAVILGLAGLLLLRAVTRVVWFDSLEAGMSIPWMRNLANVAMLVVEAGLLLLWCPRGNRREPA